MGHPRDLTGRWKAGRRIAQRRNEIKYQDSVQPARPRPAPAAPLPESETARVPMTRRPDEMDPFGPIFREIQQGINVDRNFEQL